MRGSFAGCSGSDMMKDGNCGKEDSSYQRKRNFNEESAKLDNKNIESALYLIYLSPAWLGLEATLDMWSSITALVLALQPQTYSLIWTPSKNQFSPGKRSHW